MTGDLVGLLQVRNPEATMTKLNITVLDGSVVEPVRDCGIDDLAAICVGACSCSICRVYVATSECKLLPPMDEDEDDLLNTLSMRLPHSRLACQIIADPMLESETISIVLEQ